MRIDLLRRILRNAWRDGTWNPSSLWAHLLAAVIYRQMGLHKSVLKIEREARKSGRLARQIPLRTTVVNLIAAAVAGKPPQIKSGETAAQERAMCRKAASGYAIPFDPALHARTEEKQEAMNDDKFDPDQFVTAVYETYRASCNDWLDDYDWSPSRMPDLPDEERIERMMRAYQMLDALISTTWSGELRDGVVTIDSTFIKGSVRRVKRIEREHFNDEDADWRREDGIGYSMHVAYGIDDNTGRWIIAGIYVTPGPVVEWKGAKVLLTRLRRNGINADIVVTDMGYSQNPDFQKWLAAEGIGLVCDLRDDQRGPTDEGFAGGLWIEGQLYCPCLPEHLHNIPRAPLRYRFEGHDSADPEIAAEAEAAYHNAKKANQTLRKQREQYLMAEVGERDDGRLRVTCPDKYSRHIDCDITPDDPGRLTGYPKAPGALPIYATVSGDAKVCQQRTLTVPDVIGNVPRQHVPYASKEWYRLYTGYRSPAEGGFGWMKRSDDDGTTTINRESLRVTGIGRVTIMLGLFTISYNISVADTRTKPDRHAARDRANNLMAKHGVPGQHGKDCTHTYDSTGDGIDPDTGEAIIRGDYLDTEDAPWITVEELLGWFDKP